MTTLFSSSSFQKTNEDNPKINYQEFQEFHEREQKITNKCYKGVLCFIISLNLICIGFLLFYNTNIYFIIQANDALSKDIERYENDNIRLENQNNKYFINLFYSVEINPSLITDNIIEKKEFDQLVQWGNINPELRWYMCYKTSFDGDTSDHFTRDCYWGSNIIVVINTDKGHRFGAVLTNYSPNEIIINDPKAFLFNLDKLTKFPIQPNKQAYTAINGGFFSFGQDDLVIHDHYNATAVSFSKFPNGNYGNNDDNIKTFLGEYDDHFIIKELEILISGDAL